MALPQPLQRLRRSLNVGVSGSSRISPTAHYTGYVWARSGLGPRELATVEGALAYWALQPAMVAARLIKQPTLPDALVARHAAIDHLLREAIDAGEITQIVEIAAGFSPRGTVLAAEYGHDITYIEADLPPMAAMKRAELSEMGALSDHHQVVDIDALAEAGELSLRSVFSRLDPAQGTAVVTEGLLPYLAEADVRALWHRIGGQKDGVSRLIYVSDLYLRADGAGSLEDAASSLLKSFVRSPVERHFTDAKSAEQALRNAGFNQAEVLLPRDVVPDEAAAQRAGGRAIRVLIAKSAASSQA